MPMIRSRKGAHGQKRRQWRVTVKGFPPQHGTCPTKECAKECARRAEEELRVGGAPSKLTLGELIDRYEAAVLPTIPESAPLYHQHLVPSLFQPPPACKKRTRERRSPRCASGIYTSDSPDVNSAS